MPPHTPAAQEPANPDNSQTEGGSTETKLQPQQLFQISSQAEELKKRQEEAQVLSERLQDEDIDLDSERFLAGAHLGGKTKEVEELSPAEDESSFNQDEEDVIGGLNSQNDSGLQKVLSRTKNSLQLHTFNKAGEEDEDESEPPVEFAHAAAQAEQDTRDKDFKQRTL